MLRPLALLTLLALGCNDTDAGGCPPVRLRYGGAARGRVVVALEDPRADAGSRVIQPVYTFESVERATAFLDGARGSQHACRPGPAPGVLRAWIDVGADNFSACTQGMYADCRPGPEDPSGASV